MKKNNDKIIAITENLTPNTYTITVCFQSGKKVYLDEYENEENVISFSKFCKILSITPLDDLYKLKSNIKHENIVTTFIDTELRRRHRPLNKPQKTLKQQLKGNEKQITLTNGCTLVRASQIKEK